MTALVRAVGPTPIGRSQEAAVTATDDESGGAPPAGFTLDAANRMLGEFNSRMGLRLVEIGPERIVGTIPVDGNRQPYGLLHGGANAAMAEALGSIGSALHAGPDRVAMGVELSCTHHRAARTGQLTGVCTPLHVGNTLCTWETVVTDEQGRRICTARLTCIIRDAPPGGLELVRPRPDTTP